MFTLDDLQKMSQTDEVDKGDLVDINDVKIDSALPAAQRMENYLSQIKNPYHFLCGGSVVNLLFEDSGTDLQSRLSNYFRSLKKG